MKTTMFSVLVAVTAASALSVPHEKRQATPGLTDVDVLNYALTLEHLENAFYSQGLKNYSSSDFASASNLGSITFNNIAQIGSDENNHVQLLTSALSAAGATPVQACTYKFPATDAKGFLGLSQVLEGVGIAAYIGAAQYISSAAYLTVAADILGAEVRHNSFIRLANGYSAFPSPYDTALSPKAIVSLAGSFFASCPDGSAPSIVPFPAATLTSTNVTKGSTLAITVNETALAGADQVYCAFASGVQSAFSPFNNGSCVLPTQNVTSGQVYGLLTSAQNISDMSTLAGPFILELDQANNTISTSSSNKDKKSTVNAASGATHLVAATGVASMLGALAFVFA